MAHLARSVATLRLIGDELVPDDVTKLLGVEPTEARGKGQEAGGGRVAKSGIWRLQARSREPEDLDGQVQELLDQLTADLNVWRHLSQRFRIDLFCGWFMDASNEGVSISPATLAALGARGIELGIDIYAPTNDA